MRMCSRLVSAGAVGVTLLVVPAAARSQQVPPEVLHHADLIVTNGIIYTADAKFSTFEAMAVRDGKVLALGTSDYISQMAGPRTQRVDLGKRSVVPGFFDTHLHQTHVSGQRVPHRGSVQFETLKGGLEEVRKLVAPLPPGEWIQASGPRDSKPLQDVSRSELDTVSPNNPLVIMFSGELSVVNSMAWELSGLSPDIPGVLKDKNGEPTGQLRNWAFGAFDDEALPWPRITDELLKQQKERLAVFLREGITTVVGRGTGVNLTVYRELWERGELTARIRIGHEFLRSNPRGEAYLKRMGKLVSFGLDDMVKIIGASTQHPDATSGSGAALTFKPKLRSLEGDPYGAYGENRWAGDPKENDSHNIRMAIKYGWNVNTVHNQGDKATWLFLKAIEEGHQDVLVKTSLPFGTDHMLMLAPQSLDLMKKYNVIPSMGTKYLFDTKPDSLVYQYGADAVQGMTAVRTVLDAGLLPVSESDTSQFPLYRPLWSIEKLVTRTDNSGRVWGSNEVVSRQQALWMRTLWAARYSGDEKILGSLEPGKLADFVVLQGDFMKVPIAELGEVRTDYTFVGGKMVYENKGEPDPPSTPYISGGGGEGGGWD